MSEVMSAAVRGIGAALSGLLELARVVRTTATAARHVSAQVVGVQGDDSTEVWQPYGFQARPKADAVAVQAAIGGHQESLVTLMVHDRRYTIALAEGEVAMVDDLGNKVHLTRSGIVLVSNSVKLGSATATAGVARIGDTVTPSAGLAAWIASVGAATGVGAPASSTSSITTGSSSVRSA